MLVDIIGAQTAGSGVTGAIQQASRATGVSFEYLLATAQVESGLNAGAAAKTSSARGLYQFIEQTWLGTMKESGPSLGYGRYADAITKLPSGRFAVADPALRSEILNLRGDPAANAVMAGAFTKHNAEILQSRLGREATNGELYIAHFLGAGGASRLITRAANSPNAIAAEAFPGAARANRSIFYDKQGSQRTVAEVYGSLVGRFNVASANPRGPAKEIVAQNRIAAPVAVKQASAFEPVTRAAVTPVTRTSLDPISSKTAQLPAAVKQASAFEPVTRAAVPPVTRTALDPIASKKAPTPATLSSAPSPVADTGPRSLFSDVRREPVSNFVRDLWTSRPHVAAALTGSTIPPVGAAANDAEGQPLGLFQNQAPNVRGMFTGRS